MYDLPRNMNKYDTLARGRRMDDETTAVHAPSQTVSSVHIAMLSFFVCTFLFILASSGPGVSPTLPLQH